MPAASDLSVSASPPIRKPAVTLSRWVNERCPPLTEMLSTHDVAKLTRRPAWLMRGLSLMGRFPPQIRYRGRRLGWCKAEVLAWLTREITLDESGATPRCPRHHPQQQCLPLEPCCLPITSAKPGTHRRSDAKGRLP